MNILDLPLPYRIAIAYTGLAVYALYFHGPRLWRYLTRLPCQPPPVYRPAKATPRRDRRPVSDRLVRQMHFHDQEAAEVPRG